MAIQQQVPERPQFAKTRIHLLGYICTFIFLFLEGSKQSYTPAQILSYYFLIPAFFVLIAHLPFAILKKIAKFVDDASAFPMYVVVIASSISGILAFINATGLVNLIWGILVILLAIIVKDITDIVKNTKVLAKEIGKKSATVKQLRILSLILVYFVILILIFDVQGIGKPVYWLTPALISLTISLFLDGTIHR